MKLYENGRMIAEPENLEAAVKMISGLDMSMATVLAVQSRLNGGVVTSRADLISDRVAAGSKVVTVKGERRLELPNGIFLSQRSITSIGMDYAEFILGAA